MKNRLAFKKTHLALAAATVTLLAGCGGGGGSSPAAPRTLSGVVIDGYIGGATVCLDLNANLLCDTDEPRATSALDGSYTLPPFSGSIDGLQVIAVVPVGATDSELGEITKPFDLMAPAESATAVTPLTTLVSNEMSSRQISAQEAEKSIKAELNLQTDTILGKDVTKDGELLKVAQVITASMASAKETLNALNKASDLGLTKANIVKAAVAEVKNTVLPQVLSSEGKVTIDTTVIKSQAQLMAAVTSQVDVSTQLTGKVQQIVAQSKTGSGSVLNMAEVFKSGFVVASFDDGDYLDLMGKRIGSGDGFFDKLTVEYIQFDGAIDKAPNLKNNVWLSNGVDGAKWYARYDNDDQEIRYVYDGTSWIQSKGGDLATKPDLKDNCVLLPVVAGSSVGTKVCAVAKDLSGKRMADFLKNSSGNSTVCKRIYDGAPVANCDPNQVLPANSIAYDLTFSTSADLYEIWTGSDDWAGYYYTGKDDNNPAASTPTISKFLDELKMGPQWTGSNCSVGFRVKSLATDGKSGVMEWGENIGQGCNSAQVTSFTETTSFRVEQVGGKEVLRVFYPNLYRKLNPGDLASGEAIFTVVEKEVALTAGSTTKTKINGIFNGEFSAAAKATTIPFTGNVGASPQFFNKVILDAVLKARGVEDYPYGKQ